jgi:hypothetical protein
MKEMSDKEKDTLERISKQIFFVWSGEEMAANMKLLHYMNQEISSLVKRVNALEDGQKGKA